jgi:hypothetical protein
MSIVKRQSLNRQTAVANPHSTMSSYATSSSTAATAGIGFGTALAIAISWSAHKCEHRPGRHAKDG